MTRALTQVVLNAVGIVFVAWLLPGIDYTGGILYALLAGLVIGLINLLVKPFVVLLSLPFIILSLGLFYLLINGAMLYLAGALLDGLTVQGCFPAILGGLVLAIFNWAVRAFNTE